MYEYEVTVILKTSMFHVGNSRICPVLNNPLNPQDGCHGRYKSLKCKSDRYAFGKLGLLNIHVNKW